VCNSILTLLVPVSARALGALYAVRFFTGVFCAANLPIVNIIVGKWIVYEEKTTWVAIIYAGTSLGTVISILTSGLIMNYVSWEAIFYIHGSLPFVWVVIFQIFFADSPEKQRFISERERALIVSTYGHRPPITGKRKVPWRKIFTSGPFLTLIFTNTLGNFGWYFLLTGVPLYMNKILRYDINSVRAHIVIIIIDFSHSFALYYARCISYLDLIYRIPDKVRIKYHAFCLHVRDVVSLSLFVVGTTY